MAEVLVSFTAPTRARNGDLYWGRALGRMAPDGMWEGWVEFARAGDDETVNTSREAGQATRAELRYWALGLTRAFLEGALDRALTPAPQPPAPQPRMIANPAPHSATLRHGGLPRQTVLDPFQTFVKGEDPLRSELMALSNDDLQNIVEAYGFPPTNTPVPPHQSRIVEQIVRGVRARFEGVTETRRSEQRPGATG